MSMFLDSSRTLPDTKEGLGNPDMSGILLDSPTLLLSWPIAPSPAGRVATRTRDAGLPEGRPMAGRGGARPSPSGGGGAPSGVSRLLDFVRATRVPIDPGRIRA
jgi:hypothetical protein